MNSLSHRRGAGWQKGLEEMELVSCPGPRGEEGGLSKQAEVGSHQEGVVTRCLRGESQPTPVSPAPLRDALPKQTQCRFPMAQSRSSSLQAAGKMGPQPPDDPQREAIVMFSFLPHQEVDQHRGRVGGTLPRRRKRKGH